MRGSRGPNHFYKHLESLTGDIAPGRNYLEITSPEECVEVAIRLLENANLRIRLITNYSFYYQSYLRSDLLVLYSLVTALSRSYR